MKRTYTQHFYNTTCKSTLILSFLLALCTTCYGQEKNAAIGYHSNMSNVVIIFKDCPDHTGTSKLTSGVMSIVPPRVVEYVDAMRRFHSFFPRMSGCDTLIIPTYNGFAEVMHRNQVREDNYYMLKAGDTVLFTYGKNLRPIIKSLCSSYNTWLYNLPEEDARAVDKKTGYNISTLCYANDINICWKRGYNIKEYQIPNIDSLRIVLKSYQQDYNAKLDSLVSSRRITHWYADYLKRHDTLTAILHGNLVTLRRYSKPIIASDSMMHYTFAHHLAQSAYFPMDEKGFAAISQDSTISIYARISILKNSMADLSTNQYGWHHYPKELVDKCNKIYIKLSGEKEFILEIDTVKPTYSGKYTIDLTLLNVGGKKTSLSDVLNKYKGKFIYLDIWASWCGPCVGGMPAALKLRKEYKGKNIAFVYFDSGDKVPETWRRAIEKYKISEEGGDNYLITNIDNSKFVKEIGLSKIPRMLIFDKTGKIIHLDAPRPGTPELKTILDSLINQ